MLHLGWFLSFQVQSWNQMWSGEGGREWNKPQLYIDAARSLERAGFDYMMFEDGSFVPDSYGGNHDWWLKAARSVPKQDPLPLIPILGEHTKNIGFFATVTTSFHPPFMAARSAATIDHLTDGRFGLNLVTSHNHRTAQNFGHDALFDHDERYRMADEWIDLVRKLWDSWDADAVVLDEERGMFADGSKVHPVDFEGEFYRSRGPLNTTRPPQGRPALCQAGGSNAGRAFGAKNVDTIIAQVNGVEDMKAYRDEVSEHMIAAGRDPKECKVLFIVTPVLGETDAEAQDRAERGRLAMAGAVESNLASLSYATGEDFAKYDLDAPFPDIETNATQSSLALFKKLAAGKTLREFVTSDTRKSVDLVGTPDTVAGQMDEIMQEVGGDGFLISGSLHRRYVSEIADGLGAALRRRGLARDGYAGSTLRENLLEF
ncbi:NtaA/DmoA family FMN-dependent monooxygenase [Pseudonocardia kujensis]|uniref:NtaA/DmoA family FMN-dependent monooxygenase n=1 Tax=Pseudonocardia kujensis TaxID=1128675 RepID=UPI001E29200C|nr:NtaA/DmoA family FMN-dependent monooxygenase [Pseudonocardia kujensis]MCE0766864.1 NtaA/DmoA family FMN-dependent monooxygenase [Pseudonocardia kujensis]